MSRLSLTGRCDGCGAANGLYRDGEYQCPRCTQLLAVSGAALEHFRELVGLVLGSMAETYEGTRAMEQITGMVGTVTNEVAEEMFREHVQALPEQANAAD